MMAIRPQHVAQNIKTLHFTAVFDGTFLYLQLTIDRLPE